VWIWHFLLRQWVPHDEGAFADVADRILRGEVPHRDFLDLYTGGLSYLHAFAWKVFGRDLAAFRYMLYIFSLAWLPALYYVASRFVRPVVAAALVLIAVTWSLPNYSAAVPSWYNLFFATWGTAALLRYIDTKARAWLFVAGLCGGLSFLAKISGLFFVFAAALFLVYRSQEQQPARTLARALRCVITLTVAAIIVRIVARDLTPQTFVYFIAPVSMLAGALIAREFRSHNGAEVADSLLCDLYMLAAGVALPVLCFLLVYRHGGLLAWINGVFILPVRRLQYAEFDPPAVWAIAVSAGVLSLSAAIVSSRRRVVYVVCMLALASLLALAFMQDYAFQAVWLSLSAAIPLATLAGVLLSRWDHQPLFLLVCVTALCSLVQFPFSPPVYFTYVAPLVVVLVGALIATRPIVSAPRVGFVFGCYLFAGAVLINPGDIHSLGDHYQRAAFSGRLSAEGADKLRSDPEQADLYNEMISLVRQHARGEYVYAAPSAPEVYFLSGHRNPVPWTFDFFDDRAKDFAFISPMLKIREVNVVVINTHPDFDPPPAPDIRALYARLYPHSRTFGHFEVRWRE
jgi:hypothetical protein